MLKIIYSSFIVLLGSIFICCSCRYEADLIVPQYVDQELTISQENTPTFVGPNYFPNGIRVFLYSGSFNEFYSMRRYDYQNNIDLIFYWSTLLPPPFSPYSTNPVFLPLQIGEKFKVHRFITNEGNSRGETDGAGSSKTNFKLVVKIEGGRIVENSEKKETKGIEPGEYVLLSEEFTWEGYGYYQLTIDADVDNQVVERDEDNNHYIERETKDLTEE